jgi:hypothetical protein
MTGKHGRPQTYLYVHLERIWADNATFTESWNRPPGRLVDEGSFERIVDATVHVVNSPETPLIGHLVNTTVHDVNNEVHHVNDTGHQVNVTVHEPSSKSDTRQSKKGKNERKKEESAIAPSLRSPSIHSFTLSTGYAEMYLKSFLREVGQLDKLKECAQRLQQVHAEHNIDDVKAFRDKVNSAAYSAKLADDPIEAFFKQLRGMLRVK